jgi:zinc protease
VVLVCACSIEFIPRPRPPAPPSRTATLGLSITTQTLPSGLRVVIVRDPAASDLQVTMRYQLGAADDGASPGIAHLVEHLMFQQVMDGQPVFTQLEDTATYFNAVTTFDATTYVARAPLTSLDKLLDIEAVRLEDRCKTLDDATFLHEREIVVHELEQRDQSTEIYAALYRALYPEGHPYRRPVGGSIDSVRAITREQACAFADTYYAPNNAVLVISGRFERAQIDAALARFGARVAKRTGAVPAHSPPPRPRAEHVEIAAPVDEELLVVAWPLPVDPDLQLKVRALAAALPHLVDEQVKGDVVAVELGDSRAPMLGVAMLPGDDETLKQVVAATRKAVTALPKAFEDARAENVDGIVFERIKQGAIYGLYSGLEDGSDRDEHLATLVASGRDPHVAFASELRELRELSHDEAAEIAAKYLAANTPTVVTLKVSSAKKRGEKVRLRVPIHELGRRRTPADPGLASRPLPGREPKLEGARVRVMPNGLKVVLLPVTAVPTVEARLVFGSGTADEPRDQRGVALVAAHTLTFDLHHLADVLAFARAGGMRNVDVTSDRTTFSVQGMETELDVVLAALQRWVVDGVYDDSAGSFVTAMHRAAKRSDDQGSLTDAWRAGLFGAEHPYVAAGLVRHVNPALTLAQAAEFRKSYYQPDNATLVIAGHFDPALADRWVDFLYASWSGRALVRQSATAKPQAVTIAKVDDTALLQVRIAIPTAKSSHEQELVAAEMLNDIAHDVRNQLGASYTFEGGLADTRLASFFVIGGWVDGSRAAAAAELVRDRIAALRRDPEAAARAFVVARGHVAAQLRSRVGSAAALADRVQRDVELMRDPLSDLHSVVAVEAMTIADMKVVLGELDLARATVLLDGPEVDVVAAARALGRTPSFVAQPPAAPSVNAPATTPPAFAGAEQRVYRSELRPALTEQPFPRLMIAFAGNATAAFLSDAKAWFSGYTVSGELGYRYGWTNAIGARVEIGRMTAGVTDSTGSPQTLTLVPIDALGIWHIGTRQRWWSELMVGLHEERSSGMWRTALAYGFNAGVDLIRVAAHRVGLSVHVENTTQASFTYTVFSLGLVYRR